MPPNEFLIGCLMAHVDQYPDKVAFTLLDSNLLPAQNITYAELQEMMMCISHQLRALDMTGCRAHLVYQNELNFIVSFLACLHCGVIPIPMPFIKGKRRFAAFQNIMNDSQSNIVLCETSAVAYLEKGLSKFCQNRQLQIVTTENYTNPSITDHSFTPQKQQTAFIQYSSGSTGNPKGILITHENLMHNQKLIKSIFNCNTGSIIFSWLPFHHDMGLIGNLLHTIYVGCTCFLLSPEDFIKSPAKWLEGICKYKATHSGGPNFAYDLCTQNDVARQCAHLDLSSWQVAYNGAEPIQQTTIAQFINTYQVNGFCSGSYYTCYGLAEATLLVAGIKSGVMPATVQLIKSSVGTGRVKLADHDETGTVTLVSSGSAPSGMDVILVKGIFGKECQDLDEGEICIAGESVTHGYYNKPSKNLYFEKAGKSYLKTGDIGFKYRGEIFVQGRIKEMLVIKGCNFYPYDMEQAVISGVAGLVKNGAVVFSTAIFQPEYVCVAEVERNSDHQRDLIIIINTIENILTGYCGQKPYDIVLVAHNSLPRTTSGKLQRLTCESSYKSEVLNVIGTKRQLKNEPVSIVLNMEPKLAPVEGGYNEIRLYLLGIIHAKVGISGDQVIDDDVELADLGIDSLRLMEIVNIVNRDLSINIEAQTLAQNNTLSDIINILESLLWLKNQQPVGKEMIL